MCVQSSFSLTLYQMTKFRLFQIERICRQEFRFDENGEKFSKRGRKYCGKRGNWSLRTFSSFPLSVFKRFVLQTRKNKNKGLSVKGLNCLWFWKMISKVVLICLCFLSKTKFLGVESFMTPVMDAFPKTLNKVRHRMIVIGVFCIIGFLVSLPMVTEVYFGSTFFALTHYQTASFRPFHT